MAKKMMDSGACCLCKCHSTAKWVKTLALLLLGAYGLYVANFDTWMYMVYWVLVVVGAMKAAVHLCKCCCE